MKKALLLILLWTTFMFTTYCQKATQQSTNEIVIENDQFRLLIGNNAISKSLILKSTGEECLIQDENIPIFAVTQERPYHNEIKLAHPNKKTTFQADTLYWEDEKLIVGFELVPYKAIIEIKETSAYVGFKLNGFIVPKGTYPGYLKITPPPATEFHLLQLPIRNHKYFGEWLNISWDENVAVNLLATDVNAYIDFEKRKNYKLLTATAYKNIQLEGTGAALIVSESSQLLNNIDQLEEDFDLPRGVQSRRHDLINASYYWSAEVNPTSVDKHLHYAKMGGFRTMNLYYPSFEENGGYEMIGNYEINKKLYPNGKEDLKKMLDKIKSAGITPGVHFLHSHVGKSSMYVTPVPDHRLNFVKTFTLSKDVTLDDTIIYVEQNPLGTVMADGCRLLKMGTEFISYEGYTTEHPYSFVGCKRAVNKTTNNSQPKGTIIGLVDVSEFGATSIYVDQRNNLQDELAEKIANIYDAGFQFLYFDGSEGVNPPFGLNVALAQYRVYKLLNPHPIFTEGAAKSHFSWHMLSGGNAFDVFAPEVLKEEIRKWPAEEAPRMKQDFTRINFGWLGYFLPTDISVGTQPDMLEFATSVAAGWDCPISIHMDIKRLDAHPRTKDNLEVIRRWEDVRAKKWLTEEQKQMLQNTAQEHHLLLNENGDYELIPYNQILDVAGGNRNVRAFSFTRDGESYIVYWHISGDKKLELQLSSSSIELYDKIGKKIKVTTSKNNKAVIPVGSMRYVKAKKLSVEQLSKAFKDSIVLD